MNKFYANYKQQEPRRNAERGQTKNSADKPLSITLDAGQYQAEKFTIKNRIYNKSFGRLKNLEQYILNSTKSFYKNRKSWETKPVYDS